MEYINILQFLNEKYKEADTKADRQDISILYWSILDSSLQGIESKVVVDDNGLRSPILN